jgi:hypothetical protein
MLFQVRLRAVFGDSRPCRWCHSRSDSPGHAALFERAEREGAALRCGLRNDPQSRYGAVGGRSGD